MQFVRMYTGDDGQTHFEDIPGQFKITDIAQRSDIQDTGGIQFVYQPPGHVIEMHPAPRRQYVITLQGQAELILGDGTSRLFIPGDVVLAEDITGEGHITKVIGEIPRVTAQIHL